MKFKVIGKECHKPNISCRFMIKATGNINGIQFESFNNVSRLTHLESKLVNKLFNGYLKDNSKLFFKRIKEHDSEYTLHIILDNEII